MVLRQLRGVQTGEGSRQRQLPAAPDAEAGVDSREELLLPAVEVSAAAARSFRRAPVVSGTGHPAQRDPPADRGRPAGHLGEPRRAVVGHPAAVGSVERRLRVVRCAGQLRLGGRSRPARRHDGEVVAGGSAHRRQGHHTLPCGVLAGDADGRRAAAAAACVRPRLPDDRRPADEQDARHDRRSDRGGRSPRRRSAAAVSRQGDRVWRRRRFLVEALRRALQRRPRQQPRQPGEPGLGDGRALPAGEARRRKRWRGWASRPRRITSRRWTGWRCTKARPPRSG